MKRTLALLGACALLAWTGLGLVAWGNVARRVTIHFQEDERDSGAPSELLALQDELGALHEDVRALARGFGESLQALNDGLLTSQDEHAAGLELRLAALRDEVGSRIPPSPSPDELADLLRELGTLRDALAASARPGSESQPVPSPTSVAEEPHPVEPTAPQITAAAPAPSEAPVPAAPKVRKSFLAFQLPSDDLRFDERRTWSILPALSRVGFDAKTTLHDFTATTSSLEGELEADLSRPSDAPRASVRVQAATLVSGDTERDEEMRERLAVAEHATLQFELERFEPAEIDAAAQRATGTAHGRMTVRGVTQTVAMPVKLSLDDAHRLCVEGQMTLDLTRFDVPVPNKLGLISMEKDVEVWISLRLRANPRSEG